MEPIQITYTRGEDSFSYKKESLPFSVLDFWAWAFSDCINNTTRGILAEFLVATALHLNIKVPRDAWAKYDLTYREKGIEVKSASYHQRWYQEKLSVISYSIPKTRGWNAENNIFEEEAKRQAFIYVLCLLAEKNRKNINPLCLEQWRFWVIPARFFDSRKRSQHSITYNSLLKEIGDPIHYGRIKAETDYIIDQTL